MFRLTREVRFALAPPDDPQLAGRPTNSFAGYPTVTGIAPYLCLEVTLAGELQSSSNYLRNIKEIDDVVRKRVIGRIHELAHQPHAIPARLMDLLRDAWPGTSLVELRLLLSPFLSVRCLASEHPMVRLSQTFEFCASHRLHNPAMSDEENRRTYGKCNNPSGHGHNYQVKVTLVGTPGANGILVDVPAMERIVSDNVIEKLDHKNLNEQVPEFKNVIPSVENIAKTIYRILKPTLSIADAKLASVTVWETSKTWCEYEE
jgi:6-pyruvoyltetrahydropterin/6-carboxytetrahydropterin synthase